MKTLTGTDIDSLDERQLILINQRLPQPCEHIIGDVKCLPVTLRLGCRIEVSNHADLHDGRCRVLFIDNKKIGFGFDATRDFLYADYHKDFDIVYGDAWLTPPQSGHVNTLLTWSFYHTQWLDSVPSIAERKGWCCTMTRADRHRHKILDVMADKHLTGFTGSEWFCYDEATHQGHHRPELYPFMFRQPAGIDHTSLTTDEMQRFRHYKRLSNYNPHPFHNHGHGLAEWHLTNLVELCPTANLEYFEFDEKIAKPIAAGMAFVLVAAQHTLARLTRIGFRTFDPLIDESYDQEPDWQRRTEMAVDAMFEFVNRTNDHQQLQEICDHNRSVMARLQRYTYEDRVAKRLRPLISWPS